MGPERPTYRPVVWTREAPVGGGPVAALAAGLRWVEADRVVLLAADLPLLQRSLVETLASAGNTVVAAEQPQWLCGGWDSSALRDALDGLEVQGARLRDVLAPLTPDLLAIPGAPGDLPVWQDVDTPEDLARVRSWT